MKLASLINADRLYEIDRNAAFGMAYGASLSRVQGFLDPDLHNPITAELVKEQEHAVATGGTK